jgi:hypothetical protein
VLNGVAVLVAALREHLDEQLLSSVEAHVEAQASVGGFRSYQDVLLGMGVPLVGQDTSNAIGLNLNWHMRYRLSNQHRSTTLSPPASLKPIMNPDEGWQVIKPHRVRRCVPSAAPRPAASRSYSPLYLASWRVSVSTTYLPPIGGRTVVSPPVASIAMDFGTTSGIASALASPL